MVSSQIKVKNQTIHWSNKLNALLSEQSNVISMYSKQGLLNNCSYHRTMVLTSVDCSWKVLAGADKQE